MNKTWITFTYELGIVLRRVSFWISALALPLIGLVWYGATELLNINRETQAGFEQAARDLIEPDEDSRPKGYVDQAGLIHLFPPGFEEMDLIAYQNEESAVQALRAGRISGFFVVPETFLESGVIFFTQMEGSPMWSGSSGGHLQSLIAFNLLEGDTTVLEIVREPIVKVRETNLTPAEDQYHFDMLDKSAPTRLFVPYTIQTFFVMAIMTVSALLLSSLTREQDNRVMEILLTSSGAFQVLLGKTLALGLAGLIQVLAWGGFSIVFLNPGLQQTGMEALNSVSPLVWFWGTLFFLAGYLLYSSLMVSLGVLISGLREYATVSTVATVPLMIPFVFFYSMLNEPNGLPSVILSMLPLTSSVSMVTRLVLVPLPIWQPALSLVITFLTALLCVRLTAGLFRGQMLLGGNGFYLKSLVPGFLRPKRWQ